jgi:hypothetical protein
MPRGWALQPLRVGVASQWQVVQYWSAEVSVKGIPELCIRWRWGLSFEEISLAYDWRERFHIQLSSVEVLMVDMDGEAGFDENGEKA